MRYSQTKSAYHLFLYSFIFSHLFFGFRPLFDLNTSLIPDYLMSFEDIIVSVWHLWYRGLLF